MEKTLIFVLISATTISAAMGLTCKVCGSINPYNGGNGITGTNNDCYNNLAAITGMLCTGAGAGETDYCRSEFTLKDGLWVTVGRSCAFATSVPSATCTTSFSSGTDREQTDCIQGCTTDNCNSAATTDFKKCTTDCNNGGSCNYFTGLCDCLSTHSGTDCSTAVAETFRSCLQCDQETDSTCATKTTGGVNCASSGDMYCTVSKTSMFDKDGAFIRSRVTRGCTSAPNYNDHCAITDSADTALSGNKEYTCTTTCGTDNCNTQVPDGETTGSETRALYCVQCQDTTDSGACSGAASSLRTACPNGERYCYSVATYFIANTTHANSLDEPLYQFKSIERGCASAAVEKRCNSTTVANTNVQKISCQESCQEDGCNVGWPNRPKCFKCNSETDTPDVYDDGYSRCVFNPTNVEKCDKPYEGYCYFTAYGRSGYLTSGLQADRQGYSRTMERGCSAYFRETTCANIDVNGVTFRQCNESCTTDGCNQGNSSGKLVYNMVLFSLPALLGFILQCFSQ